MLDLIVRNGELVDGTGAPRRAADIGVQDGRVVAIGVVDGPAAREIDADGLVVAPGFIDVHTHYDVQGFWDPTLSPSPLHGVTSVFGGNCGFTAAPLDGDAAQYLMAMLAKVEGMPLASLQAGVPWDWRSTAEYLDRLDGRLSINAGFSVGHSALRRVVMGSEATERVATAAERAQMETLLRSGLEAGAMGFSSSLSATHNDAAGRPVPSRHAPFDEVLQLAAVCREFPGTSLELLPASGEDEFEPAIRDLMTQMSLAAERPLNWNILNPRSGNFDLIEGRLRASDHARSHGGKVVALVMPIGVNFRLNFETGFVLDMIPLINEALSLPPAQRLERLQDSGWRDRVLSDPVPSSAAHLMDWNRYEITEAFGPDTNRYEGRMLTAIAAEEGKRPLDALLDIVCADELRTTFGPPVPPDTAELWEQRVHWIRDPRTIVGASDAGAHLDMIGTFNYTTRLLGEGVRQFGALSLEEAVRHLTSEPAGLYGMVDRGILAEGSMADMVVFDPSTVGSDPLTTRADLPAGAGRLYAAAQGIVDVLVGGQVVAHDGEFTDARPGAILRSGRDTATAALR
jgi:N-acyl-D-aspartate/D-glutamate deacylase